MTHWLGVAFGIASMCGYGASNVVGKPLGLALGSAGAIALRQFFVCIILGTALLFTHIPATASLSAVLQAILISVLGYLPLLLFFQGLRVGDVGVISALTQAKLLVTVALSVFFFNELLVPLRAWGVCLVLAGLVKLSIDGGKAGSEARRLGAGAGYALSAGLLWGIVFFLFAYSSRVLGPWLTSFVIEAGVFVCAAVHVCCSKQRQSIPTFVKNSKLAILGGASSALGTLGFNLGITYTDVSVVSAFTFSASAVSALLGRLVLQERLTLSQYAAIAAVAAGAILLSIAL